MFKLASKILTIFLLKTEIRPNNTKSQFRPQKEENIAFMCKYNYTV